MNMTLFDRYFWISTFTMIFIAIFSLQLAFIFYGIYWILRAILWDRYFTKMQAWETIEGDVLETKILQVSGISIQISSKASYVFLPFIKYKYMKDKAEVVSDVFSLFLYGFRELEKNNVTKIFHRYINNGKVTVYIHPKNKFSLLDIDKGVWFKEFIRMHYILGLPFVLIGLLI